MYLQLAIFTLFSCFILPVQNEANSSLRAGLEIASFVLAAYFLIIEIIKIRSLYRGKAGRESSVMSLKEQVNLALSDMIWELGSPILIIIVQVTSGYSETSNEDGQMKLDTWFYELTCWTTVVLWMRFLMLMRSNKMLSKAIAMIWMSVNKMMPYIVIVILGVLAFVNVFTAIR